jgi:hypothetical protein
MSLAAYGGELGLNIHSYGSVLTGVMTGVILGLGVEGLPSVVGTTCTPSTGVDFDPGPPLQRKKESWECHLGLAQRSQR